VRAKQRGEIAARAKMLGILFCSAAWCRALPVIVHASYQLPGQRGFYIQTSNEMGPLLDMTTTVTEFLSWREFNLLEWQLASVVRK
jgi:hypothetical protein